MTNDEILELAKTCGITPNTYGVCVTWKDEILKFALAIHKDGYNKGYYNACIDMAGCVDEDERY